MLYFNKCLNNKFVHLKKRLIETFFLRPQNLCLTENPLIITTFGGYIFYIYLPIIQTYDNSK